MNKNHFAFFTLIIACLFAGGTVALADAFTDLLAAGAGPSNYAVLGLGGGQVDLSLVTVNGNVGIGSGGTIVNMAPSKINGNVFESAAFQYSGPGTVTGSITINPTLLATNVTGANTAANDAATATATLMVGAINNAATITGVAGLNVIDITGGINLNNADLTLNGPANASFIINVAGNLSLVGTASLLTSGGVSVSNILYNFTASNASINTHVGDAVNGILLAAGSSSSMNLDGTFNGELIGNKISLLSGAVVTSPVPEPSPWSMIAVGGVALLGIMHLKKHRTA